MDDSHYFGLTAIVTVVMQLVFFFVAYTLKFDKVTDFAGGTNFTVLALLTLIAQGEYYTRQIVVTVFIALSRTELAVFLLYRVLKRGKDDRFDGTREKFLPFLGFWIFQMVWVWVVSMPIVFLNGEKDTNPDIEERDIIGWCMFWVGFLVQAISDFQKSAFRDNPANKGRVCDIGLWRYSRHPNYFGEILLWWGIFVSCTPVFRSSSDSWGWVSVLSPLLTMFLLLCLSGVPTSEGKHQGRFMRTPQDREAFLAYRRRTSVLFLLPPALYEHIPLVLKRIFCFEAKWYEYVEEAQPVQSV